MRASTTLDIPSLSDSKSSIITGQGKRNAALNQPKATDCSIEDNSCRLSTESLLP